MASVKFLPLLVLPLDKLPNRMRALRAIEAAFADITSFYGFDRIGLPPFEDARPYQALTKSGYLNERRPVTGRIKIGDDLLIHLSAPLAMVRAYGTHKMQEWPHPLKFASAPAETCFFGDGAAGKEELRCSTEASTMIFGEEGPIAEAEIILVMCRTLAASGLEAHHGQWSVGATGCAQCRAPFRSALNAYLRSRYPRLCRACRRWGKKNSFRTLMCAEEKCAILMAHAPQMLDFLCDRCKKHLRGVLEFLDEMSIPYFLDAKAFRDGSWLQGVVFRLMGERAAASLPAENNGTSAGAVLPELTARAGEKLILAEGGRMAPAAELLLGKKMDVACGTIFLDRVAQVLEARRALALQEPRVFLAQLGELAKRKSLPLMELLRAGDIPVRESLGRDSLKAQLKVAERMGARIALLFGQKEALDETIIVREVSSGMQETIPQARLVEFLRKRLEK